MKNVLREHKKLASLFFKVLISIYTLVLYKVSHAQLIPSMYSWHVGVLVYTSPFEYEYRCECTHHSGCVSVSVHITVCIWVWVYMSLCVYRCECTHRHVGVVVSVLINVYV